MTPQRLILAGGCCLLTALPGCAGTSTGTDGGAGDVAEAGVDVPPLALWAQPDPSAPRLIAPLSCTWHSSRRPTLRWVRPSGVERVVVEVCADRPCQRVEHTLEAVGDSARVPAELPPGVHFWRAFALVNGRRGPPSFTWGFRVPFRSAPTDLAIATYIDVNGDGYGDAIFSASHLDREEPVLYVYWGGRDGLEEPHDQQLPFGFPAEVGDLNGDGFSDALVEIWRRDETGRVLGYDRRVYLGSPMGLRASGQTLEHPHLDTPYPGPGMRISLGDVNGDGYADATSRNDDRGTLWIHLGSSQGYSTRNAFEVVKPDTRYQSTLDVMPLGDFDGDSRPDFVIQGHSTDLDGLFHVVDVAHLGAANLHGRELRPPSGAVFQRWLPPRSFQHCDLDGDGRTEIVISTSIQHPHVVSVYQHRPGSGPLERSGVLSFNGDRQIYPGMVQCAADLDGDGFNDLVGNGPLHWFARGGATGVGVQRVFEDDVRFFGQGRSSTQYTLHTANDADGDGRADVVAFLARNNIRVFSFRSGSETLSERSRIFDPWYRARVDIEGNFGRVNLF